MITGLYRFISGCFSSKISSIIFNGTNFYNFTVLAEFFISFLHLYTYIYTHWIISFRYNINTESREAFADDRTLWKQQVLQGMRKREVAIQEKNYERWARRTASHQQEHQDPHQAPVFTCQGCSRDCKSRIGLYSHTR